MKGIKPLYLAWIFSTIAVTALTLRNRWETVEFYGIAETMGYVKGFIPENAHTRVYVGKQVRIIPLADPEYTMIGEVVDVGSRIVEYPERLQTTFGAKAYGREVQIKIPEGNNLLLDEKVLVKAGKYGEGSGMDVIPSNKLLLGETYTKKIEETAHDRVDVPDEINRSETIDIKIDKSLKDITNIKASGAIYISELKRYLVISDTISNNNAVLYVMDGQGHVEDAVSIEGMNEIEDMEAITVDDDGNIYIACSQGYDKYGKLSNIRKSLLRVKRDKSSLKLDKRVYLYDLLKEAAKRESAAGWVKSITSGGGNDIAITIEGMFYHEGNLYLGFKRPFNNGRAIVLKINNIDRALTENTLGEGGVELWKEFDLRDSVSGRPTGISDLYLHENSVYILSYGKIRMDGNKKKRKGNLWVYDIAADKLSCIRQLKDLKPEGITFNPDEMEFLITFDHGSAQPSKIMRLRLAAKDPSF